MFSTRKRWSVVALVLSLTWLVLTLAGCAGKGAPEPAVGELPDGTQPTAAAQGDATAPGDVTAPPAVSDEELSYRHVPLAAEDATPGAEFTGGEPGESELIARSFENAPPLIPHTVEDLLPITKDSNACLDCHLPDVAEDMGATSVPASHLYDIRHGQTLQGLSGANFNCSQCHAPQSDAATLVDNTFEPDFRDEEAKSSSNLLETLNEGVK